VHGVRRRSIGAARDSVNGARRDAAEGSAAMPTDRHAAVPDVVPTGRYAAARELRDELAC